MCLKIRKKFATWASDHTGEKKPKKKSHVICILCEIRETNIYIHFIELKQGPEMFTVIKELEMQMNYPEN